MLEAASLLGRRGPVITAGAAVGVQGEELTRCLREAVEAQLLVPDGDSFAFRHALVAEALRARMLPTERVALSRRLASSLSDMDDQLAGELWFASGESAVPPSFSAWRERGPPRRARCPRPPRCWNEPCR